MSARARRVPVWCRKPVRHLALCAALLATLVLGHAASADAPFRMLVPSGDAPHPAVLLVPGCSGFAKTNGASVYEERAAELQAAGYFVVFVDYVGRRMKTNCAYVSQGEVSSDIIETAAWVHDQSGVDANRIFAIGWSYGGGGILAALKAMPGTPPIAKVVLYYPVCRGAGPWSADVNGLMLLGQSDDIALPALCDPIAKGMPADKLRVISYPKARHGFDMRNLPDRPDLPSGSPAYNADAADASWQAVREFLK
jgi:dienelactone hydrolase